MRYSPYAIQPAKPSKTPPGRFHRLRFEEIRLAGEAAKAKKFSAA